MFNTRWQRRHFTLFYGLSCLEWFVYVQCFSESNEKPKKQNQQYLKISLETHNFVRYGKHTEWCSSIENAIIVNEPKWNGMEWHKNIRAHTHTHTTTSTNEFFLRNQTKCVWCTLRFKSPNLSRTPIENIVHEIWFCHSFVDFKLIGVHCSFICTKIFSHWYDRITAIYDHFHWFHSVVSSFLVIKFYWF